MPRPRKPYIYLRREDLNITYVYTNEDVWSEKEQQMVRKRKLIGRLNPETNEIEPTGGKGRPRKKPEEAPESAPSLSSTAESSEQKESAVPEEDKKASKAAQKEKIRAEEAKSALEEYKQASSAKIRELNLRIDQLTIENNQLRQQNTQLCSKINRFFQETAPIVSSNGAKQ